MKSNSVLLFPGLDSLFLASKLKRWIEIPKVRNSLIEASGYLSSMTGIHENLESFLMTTTRPHLADFDRSMIALMAVQIGIARALGEVKQWDLILGCSHGDLARSVTAQAVQYADAVELVWSFSELKKQLPQGYTANVRTVDGSKLSIEQIKWLEVDQQLPVSRWCENNASVAGFREDLDRAAAHSRELGIKIKPVLPLPVHSPVMRSIAENLRYVLPMTKLSEPKWPLFSSVWVRFLTGREEIQEEAVWGAFSPVRWLESVQSLIRDHGITEFINVGPSNALTGWALTTPGMKFVDAWEILGDGNA